MSCVVFNSSRQAVFKTIHTLEIPDHSALPANDDRGLTAPATGLLATSIPFLVEGVGLHRPVARGLRHTFPGLQARQTLGRRNTASGAPPALPVRLRQCSSRRCSVRCLDIVSNDKACEGRTDRCAEQENVHAVLPQSLGTITKRRGFRVMPARGSGKKSARVAEKRLIHYILHCSKHVRATQRCQTCPDDSS